MSTTILQTVVARCREDFTVASATPALIGGTLRRLTVTAGSYVDILGTINGALSAAGEATLRIFVDGSAVGEGGSDSVGTANDTVCVNVSYRLGPVTAAQAAAGIEVGLRAAASTGTLSITATTTPATFSAVLTATELTETAAVTLPTQVPHLLLWLKADTGVTKDQSSGDVTAWADQSGAKSFSFTETVAFTAGLLLTGTTSGATGYIQTITGTSGSMVLTDIRGTFELDEAITDSGSGAGTLDSVPAVLSITGTAGSAPKYEASVVNSLPGLYFSGNKAANLAIGGSVQQGAAIEVFAVVSVSAALRAGATLLAPPAASKADCLVVTLSNATVNRNALLDTGGADEYVSTTTTITSGKALMRWRYNLGTTTGAAGVNGNAEVADATFGPAASIAWGTIGSASAGDFPLGDFRLCELLVYSWKQASTEDAVSSSDIQAIRDYLNAKYLVY